MGVGKFLLRAELLLLYERDNLVSIVGIHCEVIEGMTMCRTPRRPS